ncbi:hypothetical protein ACEZ3G_10275 [Maribacter algicola]|uniref:Uncharacterized protein n=1 Tax=Meishania litoralis TaxID=3434685 RepID=A0ACC7LJX0_9FLAO
MKQFSRIVKLTVFLSIGSLFIIGCSKDETTYTEGQELSNTELKTILETDDLSSIADNALSELYMNRGNSAKSAKAVECYSAVYSETGFTATFENCNLNGTDNINGTLSVVYETSEGSAAFTATYTDFYVGATKLSGTRSYVVTSNNEQGSISLAITSNMTITMEDESTIAESGTRTFGLHLGDSFETTTYTIEGNWTLETNGNIYKVAIGSALSGNWACAYVNEGTMTVEKNGLVVTVNFGDGTCDDMAQLTYPNGATEDISLKD